MFFWRDARDTHHEGIGLTRDISVTGLFVFTTSPPPLESTVKLKAFLPPGSSALPPLQIHGQGRVVRVDAAHGGEPRAGFAVAGERFVLRRGEEYR
jgi:multidrug efflux pump subunit AcrA (membrane-fusion protein)